MRITTLDRETRKRCDIEGAIRRLAESSTPLEAAQWRKLLELVEHLRLSGPRPVLLGHIRTTELVLSRLEPIDPVRKKKMREFMEEWRASNPDPTTSGDSLRREMRKRFPPETGIRVRVWAGWRDYGPVRDGLPVMHYRFEVRRPGKAENVYARARDAAGAERIIRKAFGW